MVRKSLFAAGAALFSLAMTSGAQAQGGLSNAAPGTGANAIAQCMVANTTTNHKQLLRAVLISALIEDKAKFDQYTGAFAISTLSILVGQCGVTLEQLESPAVSTAMGQYGGWLGEVIIGESMAKMNGTGGSKVAVSFSGIDLSMQVEGDTVTVELGDLVNTPSWRPKDFAVEGE